jgi:hypothetical protein
MRPTSASPLDYTKTIRRPGRTRSRRQAHLTLLLPAKARHAEHDTLHITDTANTTDKTACVTIAA